MYVSAENKGLTGGRLRLKPKKTRCFPRSADSKGLSRESRHLNKNRQQDPGGSNYAVIPNSYYTRMASRRQGKTGRTALGVSLGFRESMAAASLGRVHRQEPSSTKLPLEIMEARERAQVRILWCMGSSLRESGGVYSTASFFSMYLPASSSMLLNSLVNNSKALRSASVVASTDARRKPSTAWSR